MLQRSSLALVANGLRTEVSGAEGRKRSSDQLAQFSKSITGQFQYTKILTHGSEIEARMGDSKKYPNSTTFQFLHFAPSSLSTILQLISK